MNSAAPCVHVVAVGSPARGADGAGPAVAARLAAGLPPGCELSVLRGDALALLRCGAAHALVVVDAMLSGLPAGTVRRFDVSEGPLAAATGRASTHDLGVAAALELARVLGELPPRVIVYAIEGDSFCTGDGLSTALRAGVDVAVRQVRQEVDQLLAGATAVLGRDGNAGTDAGQNPVGTRE